MRGWVGGGCGKEGKLADVGVMLGQWVTDAAGGFPTTSRGTRGRPGVIARARAHTHTFAHYTDTSRARAHSVYTAATVRYRSPIAATENFGKIRCVCEYFLFTSDTREYRNRDCRLVFFLILYID